LIALLVKIILYQEASAFLMLVMSSVTYIFGVKTVLDNATFCW